MPLHFSLSRWRERAGVRVDGAANAPLGHFQFAAATTLTPTLSQRERELSQRQL